MITNDWLSISMFDYPIVTIWVSASLALLTPLLISSTSLPSSVVPSSCSSQAYLRPRAIVASASCCRARDLSNNSFWKLKGPMLNLAIAVDFSEPPQHLNWGCCRFLGDPNTPSSRSLGRHGNQLPTAVRKRLKKNYSDEVQKLFINPNLIVMPEDHENVSEPQFIISSLSHIETYCLICTSRPGSEVVTPRIGRLLLFGWVAALELWNRRPAVTPKRNEPVAEVPKIWKKIWKNQTIKDGF